ncbi:AAA family ATPase [Lysobacter niastensis]|uniref:AAA family ATPase n=1 Tax=Lysobacter niastensis TaxID=380629 RepID=A0ABS0B6U5_9GAMM|nr:AAA family ATPase [Lysobacter niastensis]MBF6022860.1 AAA family ATPase [Lysobacter niastensis]
MSDAHYAAIIEAVARELCGDPNPKLSSGRELRYGSNGSLSVDLDKATWYDHEAGEGGGVLALVMQRTGRSDAKAWLREHGYDVGNVLPAEVAYDYFDESGELLYQVVRKPGHKFLQRQPEGSGWAWNLKGVTPVLYRLPELLARPTDTVFVVEGEKDADNLAALGLLATTNSGGAGKWRDAYADVLTGRDVVVLPDNDAPGRAHAEAIVASLAGKARGRVVELPGLRSKGDVSDWLAAGGTREALLALCAESAVTAAENALRSVPLDDVMSAEPEAPQFVMEPVMPKRVVTLFGGHGGAGKSMLGLTWCAHVAAGRPWGAFEVTQAPVVYLSLEDEGRVVRYRLRHIIEAYSLHWPTVASHLRIFDGSDVEAALMVEVSDGGVSRLAETSVMGEIERAAAGAGLVVLDNASDAYAGNENARLQVRTFMRRLAKLARAGNAAVVLLAHIDKNAAKNGAKDNSYSGSTAWHNSARSRLALVEEDGQLELRHEKSNWGAKAEPLRLARGDHGVIVPIGSSEGDASLAKLVAQADQDNVLGLLVIAIGAGQVVTTAESGPLTTWHVLSKLAEFPPAYQGRLGRRRLEAALVALERADRIRRRAYTKPNRHQGECWELAQIDARSAA